MTQFQNPTGNNATKSIFLAHCPTTTLAGAVIERCKTEPEWIDPTLTEIKRRIESRQEEIRIASREILVLTTASEELKHLTAK